MEKSSGIDYFSKLRKVTNLVGFKLTNKGDKWDAIRLWIFPVFVYSYTAIVLVRKWSFANDMEDILYAAGLGNCVPRIALSRLQVSNFADIFDFLQNIDLPTTRNKEKLQASLKKVTTVMGNIAPPFGISAMLVVSIGWFFSNRGRPLPFITMPEWSLNYSSFGCVIIQVLIYCLMAHEYVMVDVLKVCILLHLQIHFRNLRMNIKYIVEQAKEDFNQESGAECSNEIPWYYLRKKLGKVVSYHNSLLKISEKVETVYNKCVLSSFINLSLFACLTMYSMSLFPLLSVEFAVMIFYTTVILLMFFVDCFFTQQVITESEEVAHSCYESDFVGGDPKFQKALVIIMRMAQNSVKFTIGKFAPLSVATCVVITNATISYFMILRNIKNM